MPIPDLTEAQTHEIVERWHSQEKFLVEMLQDVQHAARHLPQHALEQISSEVGAPLGRLYHLATFFKGFSLTPTGEHMVQVCLGTACHVKGAVRVLEACGRELGIEPGQTSEDGQFSLEPVRCVGCCGLAAVMTVDEDLFGHVTSVKVSRLLKKYKRAEIKQEVA